MMKKVHWRAVVGLPDGRECKAWAKGVSERRVVIRSQTPLRPGTDCGLTIYAAQLGKGGAGVIRTHCRVLESVLSSAEYLVWLQPLELMEEAQWLQGN